MKTFAVLLATVVVINAGSVRVVRQVGPGWPAPTSAPPPTGWPAPTTLPPTGWPAPTTLPPSGWSAPPAPVSGTTTTIALDAGLAAVGDGWAAENHADSVSVLGAGGWGGPDAELAIISVGESVVGQGGDILQITSQDGSLASSINSVSVAEAAAAGEGQDVVALGLDISNAQSGWAGAAGEGASAAAADSILLSAPNTSGLGMAKP